MRATRRRPSTTEHGHAVSIRGYQSDPWSVERPLRSAPRSYPALAYGGALTGITPYQLAERIKHEPTVPFGLCPFPRIFASFGSDFLRERHHQCLLSICRLIALEPVYHRPIRWKRKRAPAPVVDPLPRAIWFPFASAL